MPTQGQIQAQGGQTAQVTLTKPPVVSVPAVVSSAGVTTLPVTVAGISVAIGQAQKTGVAQGCIRKRHLYDDKSACVEERIVLIRCFSKSLIAAAVFFCFFSCVSGGPVLNPPFQHMQVQQILQIKKQQQAAAAAAQQKAGQPQQGQATVQQKVRQTFRLCRYCFPEHARQY